MVKSKRAATCRQLDGGEVGGGGGICGVCRLVELREFKKEVKIFFF